MGLSMFALRSMPADKGVAYCGSGWCDLLMILTSIMVFLIYQEEFSSQTLPSLIKGAHFTLCQEILKKIYINSR